MQLWLWQWNWAVYWHRYPFWLPVITYAYIHFREIKPVKIMIVFYKLCKQMIQEDKYKAATPFHRWSKVGPDPAVQFIHFEVQSKLAHLFGWTEIHFKIINTVKWLQKKLASYHFTVKRCLFFKRYLFLNMVIKDIYRIIPILA